MTERPYDTATPVDVAGTSTHASDADLGTKGGLSPQHANDSTTAVVGDEAKSLAFDTAQSGRHVAETAAGGVKDVTSEVTTQLRQLFEQVRSELDGQASSQGERAASGLRSIADELKQMASSTDKQGIAGELAQQASDRAHSAADWLSDRQPGDMVDELRSFARRRPGTFLLGAAVLGVLGGRMTRGLTGESGSAGATGSGSATDGDNEANGRPGSGMHASVPTPTAAMGTPSDDAAAPYAVGIRDSETHAVTPSVGSTGAVQADLSPEGYGGAR
jgi:hypothetical protein